MYTQVCVCLCARFTDNIWSLTASLAFLFVCVLCPPQPYLLWLSEKVIQSSLESDFIWQTRPQNKHKEHIPTPIASFMMFYLSNDVCMKLYYRAREKTKQQKKLTKVLYLYDDKRVECNFHVEISNKNRVNKNKESNIQRAIINRVHGLWGSWRKGRIVINS